MATALETMAGELATKRTELAEIFEKSKTSDGRLDLKQEQLDDVRARHKELDEKGKAYATARDLDEMERKNKEALDDLNEPRHPSRHGNGRHDRLKEMQGEQPEWKSLGQQVLESKAAKAAFADAAGGGQMRPFKVDLPDFDVKTVMAETGAGYAPPNYRTNIVVFSPQRRPVVADLIPQDPTELQVVKYMEETTFTNSSANTAEGSSAPESALAFTERTVLVEWIPTTLPVTDQQMEDVPGLMGILNNRMTLMIRLTEESQLLNGTGTTPQLKSFLGASLAGIGSVTRGSDPFPTAIYKSFTNVRFTGFADPSGVIINPTDWQTIKTLQATTGQYIFGSPSEVGPDTLWGCLTVVTPAITQGTALTGDFLMYSHISRRRGLRIEVGYVNDDFKKGQKTIRADERLSLEIYRPQAFCTITF